MRKMSIKNKYYVEFNRKKELLYFVKQYRIWEDAADALLKLSKRPNDLDGFKKYGLSDPVAKCAEARERYINLMNIVDEAVKETDPMLGRYILIAILNDLSYDKLTAHYGYIPCSRKKYYELYNRFFFVLNKIKWKHEIR